MCLGDCFNTTIVPQPTEITQFIFGQPLSLMTAAEPVSRQHHHPEPPAAAAYDPVCGMTVDPATATHRAEHAGHSYFFCSAGCREKFTAEPARYVTAARPADRRAC